MLVRYVFIVLALGSIESTALKLNPNRPHHEDFKSFAKITSFADRALIRTNTFKVLDGNNPVLDEAEEYMKANLKKMSKHLQDQHIVFVGDSITRYQYLNLAYLLMHGQFETTDDCIPSPSVPCFDKETYDWNAYFNHSNAKLQSSEGSEVCDCYRSYTGMGHCCADMYENRYSNLPKLNAMLRFFFWGNFDLKGHGLPGTTYGDVSCKAGACSGKPAFEFKGFDTGIIPMLEAILQTSPTPTHIVLEHSKWGYLPAPAFTKLLQAGKHFQKQFPKTQFIWKTETRSKDDNVAHRGHIDRNKIEALENGWGIFDLWNASAQFNDQHVDEFHFTDRVNTYWNYLFYRQFLEPNSSNQ